MKYIRAIGLFFFCKAIVVLIIVLCLLFTFKYEFEDKFL